MTLAPDRPAAPVGEDDALARALSDPEVRASLAVIAANAPTLAALTGVLNGLLQRSPEIVDNVNGVVQNLRDASSDPDNGTLGQVRTAVGSLTDLAPLAPALAARTDTITGFLDSSIVQPDIVEIIGRLGEAAREADERTRGKQMQVGGVFALMRELKDPKVQETLAFLVEFAKVFGESQTRATGTA